MPPKWKVLADELAEEITTGRRPVGSPLPHITDLVTEGRGSKATVSRAYGELHARGLVTSRRGHGTVVRDRTRVRVPLSRFDHVLTPGGDRGPWETATAAQGLDGRIEVEPPAGELLDAPPAVEEYLALPPGSSAVRRRRRAMLGVEPVALQEAWYPPDIARAAGLDSPEKIKGGALGALVAAGIIPAEADEHVTSDAPTADEAARLGVGTQVSVLRVDRVTRDAAGRPIELVRLAAAADRVSLLYAPLPLQIDPTA
ncbi:GntR family transcriptional regulator [Streptomyces diastaticus]|uniref:GntR family transcriptional regulator n=1 Tax=Streptomyces diastaticus TaxID=1956 RepID=UPI0036ACE2BC